MDIAGFILITVFNLELAHCTVSTTSMSIGAVNGRFGVTLYITSEVGMDIWCYATSISTIHE